MYHNYWSLNVGLVQIIFRVFFDFDIFHRENMKRGKTFFFFWSIVFVALRARSLWTSPISVKFWGSNSRIRRIIEKEKWRRLPAYIHSTDFMYDTEEVASCFKPCCSRMKDQACCQEAKELLGQPFRPFGT